MIVPSAALALALVLVASAAAAQTESLTHLLEEGQRIEVRDDRGQEFRAGSSRSRARP